MNFPALLSLVCGFASLSIEILWVRLYGFAQSSTPVAFGFVLMAYLTGIALGAHLGGKACRKDRSDQSLWNISMMAVLLSALTTVALPHLYASLSFAGNDDPVLTFAIIGFASATLAFVFPIAHHLGADRRSNQQGRRFATVYTANVMGAAVGPLMTGYILLEMLTLQQTYLVIALVQLVAVIFFSISIAEGIFRRLFIGGSVAVIGAVVTGALLLDPHGLIQQLNQGGQQAKTVIENRHGVITLFTKPEGDDAVYGGNVYDGRTNLDPEVNTNGLQRPLLLAALQPQPKRVLMVGLSIGTWLALAREFPGVEHIDVIEINPGYIEAILAYPVQAQALRDPKVNLVIDDARRWLRLNQDRRYDLVIMNTTWHWRANASLLLSEQFLKQIRSHMATGAVMAFNATGSPDAFHTAAHVFPHAYRYVNFVYAADFDFRARKDDATARKIYRDLQLGDRPFFNSGSPAIEAFLAGPFQTVAHDQKVAGRDLELITDQNMLTEFKYGRRLY